MFELVITTWQGVRHSVGVRDWREANAELARFERDYFRNHPDDRLSDASVLDNVGNRVSRYNGSQLEIF